MRVQASWMLAAAGGLLMASAAQAAFIVRVEVTAHTLSGSDSWIQDFGVINDDTYHWEWGVADGENASPFTFANGATLHGFSIDLQADPVVNANFNVAAGVMNTTFTVNSAVVAFTPIHNAIGRASAFIGVTDSATFGDVGQIALTGLQPGDTAYSARFNGNASTFANLIDGAALNVAPGSSTAFTGASSSFPGYDLLGATVSDIQSQFHFTLSRFDRATGTSTFEVIPAPGAAALLALGAFAAGRRRRVI